MTTCEDQECFLVAILRNALLSLTSLLNLTSCLTAIEMPLLPMMPAEVAWWACTCPLSSSRVKCGTWEAEKGVDPLQFITLKCGLCKQLSRVEMSIQKPKCDKCGHQLPTKRLKMAKRPELMALAHALQPCYEGRQAAS